jgi:hypothetical protein
MMTEWEYHTPPDIDETMSEHLGNFPRQPYMLIYAIRSAAALLLRAWMRVYHRLRVDGQENMPETGSFVLVCNHTSHLDTLSMLCSVPLKRLHQTFPAAAADYFFSSLPRSAESDRLLRITEQRRQCADHLSGRDTHDDRGAGQVPIRNRPLARRQGFARTAMSPRRRTAGMAERKNDSAAIFAAPAHRCSAVIRSPGEDIRIRAPDLPGIARERR